MDQPSLFSASAGDSEPVPAPASASVLGSADPIHLRFPSCFEGWQGAARRALAQQWRPERIWWDPQPAIASPIDMNPNADEAEPAADRHRVPREFLRQAAAAACHRAPDRWALLYRLLWRLAGPTPRLLEDRGDPDVVRLHRYAKAVARDVHKMKAFVRFREASEPGRDEPRFVAWFEPEHLIVEYASPFFRRRFTNMRWSILTPERCAHWEGSGQLWFSDGVDRGAAPANDRFEEAWQSYYASIFNPARIKVQAMRSEMPQKYWKNLPEAALIGTLLKQADARVSEMVANPQPVDQLRCGPRPLEPAPEPSATPDAIARSNAGAEERLHRLEQALARCRRCAWACGATQAVFGEGPATARILVLGEQPGDTEDLHGRPFVGPAGRVLNAALQDAGIDRDSLYLTNAVKHFKFNSVGRRRIHETPNAQDIFVCQDWFEAERTIIQPALVLCLGRSALVSFLGRSATLKAHRGQLLEHRAQRYRATVHPAHLLRSVQATSLKALRSSPAYQQFIAELAPLAEFCSP